MDWGGIPQNSFHFTTDIFSEKNRGLPEKSENKMLPALEKAEASCSADMRFERTASTAAVRTQRRMFLLGVPKPLVRPRENSLTVKHAHNLKQERTKVACVKCILPRVIDMIMLLSAAYGYAMFIGNGASD